MSLYLYNCDDSNMIILSFLYNHLKQMEMEEGLRARLTGIEGVVLPDREGREDVVLAERKGREDVVFAEIRGDRRVRGPNSRYDQATYFIE